jgi:hypothetical protein
VACDAEQPGAHGRATPERRQVAVRLEEHLLLDVLGQRGITQGPATVAKYRGSVAVHHDAQRGPGVSGVDQIEYVPIGVVVAPGPRKARLARITQILRGIARRGRSSPRELTDAGVTAGVPILFLVFDHVQLHATSRGVPSRSHVISAVPVAYELESDRVPRSDS